jgi:hypothetical protein
VVEQEVLVLVAHPVGRLYSVVAARQVALGELMVGEEGVARLVVELVAEGPLAWLFLNGDNYESTYSN